MLKKSKEVVGPLQQIFLEANKLQQEGVSVINLGIGDPRVSISPKIRKAAIKAVKGNINYYIPVSGSKDFLQAISDWYEKRGVEVPLSEIVAAGGSRIILDKVLQVLIKEEGDIILIPSPYYPSFVAITKAYGGKPEIIETRQDAWTLKASRVEERILNLKKEGKSPKALIINSPNNPTGAEISRNEMIEIAKLAKKYNFWIISDECYQNFSSNPKFTFRKLYKKAIIVDSASKTFAMTGYRVGWGLMPEEIAKLVRVKLGIHLSSFSSISERAALEALKGEGIKDFTKQRKIIYDWLKRLGLGVKKELAGFYVFLDCSVLFRKSGAGGSLDLARYFLNEAHVAVAPGIAFGNYDNYLRISYCVDEKVLAKALANLEKVIKDLL